MEWHMTLVLGALMVLIIAQSHPSLAASSRRTLEKQQLHHDGRAVGSDHLPLGTPFMVGESKRRGNMRPPTPLSSGHTGWGGKMRPPTPLVSGPTGYTPTKRDLSPVTTFAPPPQSLS